MPGIVQPFIIDSNFLNHFGTDLFSRKSCGELQEEGEKWLKTDSLGGKKDDGDVKDMNYNSRVSIY